MIEAPELAVTAPRVSVELNPARPFNVSTAPSRAMGAALTRSVMSLVPVLLIVKVAPFTLMALAFENAPPSSRVRPVPMTLIVPVVSLRELNVIVLRPALVRLIEPVKFPPKAVEDALVVNNPLPVIVPPLPSKVPVLESAPTYWLPLPKLIVAPALMTIGLLTTIELLPPVRLSVPWVTKVEPV